jgi:hypothetical protein
MAGNKRIHGTGAASGQLAANATLIRRAVSLSHPAIFSSRSRMVENSPLQQF